MLFLKRTDFALCYLPVSYILLGYTPYEGFNLAIQISRKLGVFDPKLEERHFIVLCYFDINKEMIILKCRNFEKI